MATKVFPYAVVWQGEIVPANTPIVVKEEKPVDEKPTEKPTKKAVKKRDEGTDSKS